MGRASAKKKNVRPIFLHVLLRNRSGHMHVKKPENICQSIEMIALG